MLIFNVLCLELVTGYWWTGYWLLVEHYVRGTLKHAFRLKRCP